jgi:hypothetical protein
MKLQNQKVLLFLIIIFVNVTLAGGQPIKEIQIEDFSKIQNENGNEYPFSMLKGIPIWRLDTTIAINLLDNINIDYKIFSTCTETYILELGQHIKNTKLFVSLNKLLEIYVNEMKKDNYMDQLIPEIPEELLLEIIFQDSTGNIELFKNKWNRLLGYKYAIFSIQQPKQKKKEKSKVNYIEANKHIINFNIVKFLQVLNRLAPQEFSTAVIDSLLINQDKYSREYKLAVIPNRACFGENEGSIKLDTINSVVVQKNLIDKKYIDNKNCWVLKISKKDNYILYKNCIFGPRAGGGETFLVNKIGDNVRICTIDSWKY